MEESCEDKQAHGFIAPDLARRRGKKKEQVIERVTKDRCPRRNRQTNRPESEHGKEAIAGHGQAGERYSRQEDMGPACSSEQRVHEASRKCLHLPANGSWEHSCYSPQQREGSRPFPDSQANKTDQRHK